MTFSIDHRGDEYAVDIVPAYAVTRVTEAGGGRDAATEDLPGDFRERIADQVLADWAADCCTVPTPAERHLARRMARVLLPDPGPDEQATKASTHIHRRAA